MLKPPITRMGGKSKLRKKIIEKIPDHNCYIELFFGAGWVYFGKEPSKVEVINDIDRELINLFKMIKYHAPEIERQLKYEFSGRDIFEEYKNCTLEYMTEIHRALRFLYLINNREYILPILLYSLDNTLITKYLFPKKHIGKKIVPTKKL